MNEVQDAVQGAVRAAVDLTEQMDVESLTLARCIRAFDTMFREGRPADAHRRPVSYSLPVFGGPWLASTPDEDMVKRILLHLAARYGVELVEVRDVRPEGSE